MKNNHAVLLIDLQTDFLAPAGRMPISQAQVPAMLDACHRAYEQASARNWPVVAIGNEFSRWDPLNLARRFASVNGSKGAQWDSRAPQGHDVYFAKRFTSAFSNPDLDRWLQERQIGNLHLAGLQAKACVKATAKAALRRGYRVWLIEPAIGDTSDAARSAALIGLRRLGCEVSPLSKVVPCGV